MKNRNIIMLFLLLPIFAVAGNIDDILIKIKNNNLELKSLQQELNANIQEIKSTNNLNDPEVEGEYLFGNQNIGDKWAVGVSQSFEWPGIYGARSKANASKISALGYVNQQKYLAVMVNAKLLFIDLININKQLVNQIYLKKEMSALNEAYSKGFNHGEINILDINKLKIEILNINQVIEDLTNQRNVILEELRVLNGGISLETMPNASNYSTNELKSLQYYIDQYNEKDPEASSLMAREISNKQNLSITKMQGLPNFSIGYKYANELGDKFNGVTASISIPIFSNRNKVSAAKAKIIAESFSKDNISVSRQSKISVLYAQALRLESQIKSYSDVITQNETLTLLKKALDGGQINLLQYLMETRYYIEAQKKLIELEYQYQTKLAELNKYSLL